MEDDCIGSALTVSIADCVLCSGGTATRVGKIHLHAFLLAMRSVGRTAASGAWPLLSCTACRK
eukprot:9248017-Heterocapsa_arctica.AAC.1